MAPSAPPTAPEAAAPEEAPLARTQSGPALPTEPVMPKKGPAGSGWSGAEEGFFWEFSRDLYHL